MFKKRKKNVIPLRKNTVVVFLKNDSFFFLNVGVKCSNITLQMVLVTETVIAYLLDQLYKSNLAEFSCSQ